MLFYLSINKGNLVYFFSKGLCLPEKYIKGRINDIQSQISNAFLFTKQKAYLANEECVVEVYLKEDEQVEKYSDDLFLYKYPFPISRIRKISVKTEKQRKMLLFDINAGDAFLPENLIESVELPMLPTPMLMERNGDIDIELGKKIIAFDKLLGGLALMRIAGTPEQNYSQNYFNTLGNFNQLINKEASSINPNGKSYSFLFNKNDKFYKDYQIIYEEITDKYAKNYFKEKNRVLPNKNGLFQFDKLSLASSEELLAYMVALLGSFGEKTRRSLDDFIAYVQQGKLPESKKEGLILNFGINKGYCLFRNKYDFFEKDIKFRLDSRLDYYTIESVYETIFNNNTSSTTFPYIDNFVPESKKYNVSKYDTLKVLDKDVILGKKKGYNEEIKRDYDNIKDQVFNLFKTLPENEQSMLIKLLSDYTMENNKFVKNESPKLVSKENLYTEVQLNEMDIEEVKSIALSMKKGIRVSANSKKETLIKNILQKQG
jgi:hypothetical protein